MKSPLSGELCSSAPNTIVIVVESAEGAGFAGGIFSFQRSEGFELLKSFPGNSGLTLDASKTGYSLTVGAGGGTPFAIVDGQACSTRSWMACTYPPRSQAEKTTRLVDVVWPGSHDSGMASLEYGNSDTKTDAKEANNDKNCSSWQFLFNYATEQVFRLSPAQPASIIEQLEGGMRYLDFRIGWDGQNWRILHTNYSYDLLKHNLQDVASGHRIIPRSRSSSTSTTCASATRPPIPAPRL